jgi:hypothetical protein
LKSDGCWTSRPQLLVSRGALYQNLVPPTKLTLTSPILAEPHGNGKLTEGKCPVVVGLSFVLMNPP